MAILSKDRKIRLFDVLTGKISKTIDESLEVYSGVQQVISFLAIHIFTLMISLLFFPLTIKKNTQQLANMEFGRRIAIEKDIERNEAIFFSNLVFDESGIFLMYSTLLGVKSMNKIFFK